MAKKKKKKKKKEKVKKYEADPDKKADFDKLYDKVLLKVGDWVNQRLEKFKEEQKEEFFEDVMSKFRKRIEKIESHF